MNRMGTAGLAQGSGCPRQGESSRVAASSKHRFSVVRTWSREKDRKEGKGREGPAHDGTGISWV